jgi:hypothetical protein
LPPWDVRTKRVCFAACRGRLQGTRVCWVGAGSTGRAGTTDRKTRLPGFTYSYKSAAAHPSSAYPAARLIAEINGEIAKLQ